MSSLCQKCENCRFALQLSINVDYDEWRRTERWWTCSFLLAFNTRRPCRAGADCTVFQLRSKSPTRYFWNGLPMGISHYSLYQRDVKGKAGIDYTPKRGDIVTFVGMRRKDIGDMRRKVVYGVENGSLLFFCGQPHGSAHEQRIDLYDRKIVGYTTPMPTAQDALTRAATQQNMLDVPPTGISPQRYKRPSGASWNGMGLLVTYGGHFWDASDICRERRPNSRPLKGST